MNITNIFKFINVRPPYQISAESLQNFFVRNEKIETSSFYKSIKELDKEKKFINSLKIASKYIEKNAEILSKIPDFSILVRKSPFVKKLLEDEVAKKYVEYYNKVFADTKVYFATDEKKDRLWNLFYAMTLLPCLYPQKRERLYDCLRFMHFINRVNNGAVLSWTDFKNIRALVPSELFSNPEPKKKNDEQYKKLQEKLKKDLKTVYEKVQTLDKAISEVKQADIEFNVVQSKQVTKPVVSTKIEKKGLFNFKEKKQITTVTYEIPEPQNWLNLDFAKDKLSAATLEIIHELPNENNRRDASQIVSNLESKIYDSTKSYIYSLTPQIRKIISAESEFAKLLEKAQVPAKYFSTSAAEDNIELPDDVPITPESAWARGIRLVGIGDLKIVRQTFKEYRVGEIAHIENVLASEIRERKHITEQEIEETIIVESEELEEQQKDLQTTERFELQKEAENTINNELKVNTGFSVSGSYGPVTAEAHGDFALSMSSSQSEKTASDFAKEVINRSVSKIMTRVREERTTRTLEKIREINKHAFDNSKEGAKNITGIYRWVDKYYEAQIVNYGKRLMIELIVPEPSAFYKYTQGHLPASNSTLIKPKPPVIESTFIYFSHGSGWASRIIYLPLKPQMLGRANYLDFVAQYNVQDVEPYPKERIRLSCSVSGETSGDDAYFGTVVEKLNIPDIYECDTIWGKTVFQGLITTETDDEGDVVVTEQGNLSSTLVSGVSFDGHTIELTPRTGILPISLSGYAYSYNVSVVASCKITNQAIQDWQLKTFEAIMNAYENALAKYNESIAASQIFNGPNIQGKNPDANRRIEQDELKRAALKIITNNYHITQVARVDDTGTAIPNSYDTYTDEEFDAMKDSSDGLFINIPEAIKEGPIMQFFEQAFEWDNMTYRFYPYFYGRDNNWIEAINTVDADPLFAEFLKAGAARVVIPVRPAYQEALLYYLATNIIWNGGSVPGVGSDLYVSVTDELKEGSGVDFENLLECQDGCNDFPCKEGEPWEVKLPTSLVYLQKDNDLNSI